MNYTLLSIVVGVQMKKLINERIKAKKLIESGLNYRETAKKLGVSVGSVYYWCKDLLPRRIQRTKQMKDKYNLNYRKIYSAPRRKEQIEKINKILPKRCYFCGNENGKIPIHNKKGIRHSKEYSRLIKLLTSSPDDWVRLCMPCHNAVHWLMKQFHLTWEDIIQIPYKNAAVF